jgi:predicted nucleotidyltransferase
MKSRVLVVPKTESEMLDLVQDFFARKGYRVLNDFKIRTWRPDLVAIKGDQIIIVEVKGPGSDVRKGLLQAAFYAMDATFSYLAVPKTRLEPHLLEVARALGVGIVSVDDGIETALKPKRGRARRSLLDRIQRHVGGGSRKPTRRPTATMPLHRLVKHGRLLDSLLAQPDRSFTVRELSRESGISYPTTWRLVMDLRALGVLRDQRVGESHLLTLNTNSPVVAELKRVGSVELSPHRRAAMRFAKAAADLEDVERIVLFGGVAKRQARLTSDIDVAVMLGRESQATTGRIYQLASKIGEETGMKIAAITISRGELGPRNPLLRAIEEGEVLYERH